MTRFLHRRPSPAMIVACLALLVSLGGTSIAAVSQLAPNSVGTAQLKNGAVTNAKVKNNAIDSAKVRNRSLLRSDFALGQLPAGPPGPPGPPGANGAAGPAGPAGVIGAITVRTAAVTFADTNTTKGQYTTRQVTRECNSGERAISAGTGWSDTDLNLELWTAEIRPLLNPQSQVIGFTARGGSDEGPLETSTFTLYVFCYTP